LSGYSLGMSDDEGFSVEGAREAAGRGTLAEWVSRFLSSPGSDNPVLAEQLTDSSRWWLGPVELPIDQLHRLSGPPGDPVLCPVDEDEWRDDVDDMQRRINQGWTPPPVIVTYRDAQLVLEDGNHRVEALRRAGADQSWAVVGFESREDRERFPVRVATPPGTD
jgi:hypothetical protein